ncbi:MAG: hypothetical protein Q9167_007782, partial [Letrouitia subvulpina]
MGSIPNRARKTSSSYTKEDMTRETANGLGLRDQPEGTRLESWRETMARSRQASSPEEMDVDCQSDVLGTQSLVPQEENGSRRADYAIQETQQPQDPSKKDHPSDLLEPLNATTLLAEDAAGIKSSGRPTTQEYHHHNIAQSKETGWKELPVIEETQNPQGYPSSGSYVNIKNTIEAEEKNKNVGKQTRGSWLPSKGGSSNAGILQGEKSRKPLPAPIERRSSARLKSLVSKPRYNDNYTEDEDDGLETLFERAETRSITPMPPPRAQEIRQDSGGRKRKPQRLVLRPPKPPSGNDGMRSATDDSKRQKVTPSAVMTGSPRPITTQNASLSIVAPVDACPIATQYTPSSIEAPISAGAIATPVSTHAITMPRRGRPPLSATGQRSVPPRRGRPPLSAPARPSTLPLRSRPLLGSFQIQDASLPSSSSLSRSTFPGRLPAPESAPASQLPSFERFKQPRCNSIPTGEALANRRLFFHIPWVLNDTRLCFLGLPRPIRRKIYILCLSGGKFHPFAHSSYSSKTANRIRAGREAPAVALLRTCKLVFMEAEPVLYGYNTFCLHTGPAITAFLNMMRNPVRRSWIRSVETSISAQDMTSKERDLVVSRLEGEGEGLEKEKELHHAVRQHLAHVIWPKKLKPILAMKLEYLFVDLTEAS